MHLPVAACEPKAQHATAPELTRRLRLDEARCAGHLSDPSRSMPIPTTASMAKQVGRGPVEVGTTRPTAWPTEWEGIP